MSRIEVPISKMRSSLDAWIHSGISNLTGKSLFVAAVRHDVGRCECRVRSGFQQSSDEGRSRGRRWGHDEDCGVCSSRLCG